MRTWRRPSTSRSFTGAKSSGLTTPPLTSVYGERNYLRYLPLGVGVVIPPWNFPLAILTGLTLASVVAGTPCSEAFQRFPRDRYKLFEALEEAGMPPGVVNFLPARVVQSETSWWDIREHALWASRGRRRWGCTSTKVAAKTRRGRSG